MVDEIIKLIECITKNPVVQGAVIAYIIFGAIVVLIAVAVFVFVFQSIIRIKKRWK